MIRTSQFLAAFREPDEPLHLRGFKPRNALETAENKPLLLDTSLSDLTSSRELQNKLKAANKHLGIYFAPNVGGSTDASITRFTSWFVESDSLTIAEQHERFDRAPIQPSVRVETRKSVHGSYLIAGDCNKEQWIDIQLRLIHAFDGDPKIINPARVMRLPNFDHLHLNGNGLERKKVEVHTFEPERRHTVVEMREAFPAPEPVNIPQVNAPPSNGPFETWEQLNTEAGTRIRNLSGARADRKGWTHAPGVCHGSTDGKALFVAPDGAYGCHSKCVGDVIRASLGLPEHPASETASLPSLTKPQSQPTKDRKKGKNKKSQALFADVEVWPEPVNGSELLDEIVVLLERYVDAPLPIYRAAALWALFTHAFECFFTLPILLLVSPTKRSGKTTLLQVLGSIAARPLLASSISAASLFRAIEEFKLTLLIDEADSFLLENEDLRNILNSGHTRATAQVIRCDENLNVKVFSTFAPKLLAMIGKPQDTIVDRSVMLRMERAKASTRLEYLRADRLAETGAPLSAKAARFALDNAAALRESDPEIPAEITNARARDNWRSLLSVADVCGGQWPAVAREAARELSGSDDLDNESVSEMLLCDIRLVFTEANAERLFSKTLIEQLVAMADRPWPEANNGKAITPAWLSRRLRPFSVFPKSIRIEPSNAKGYELGAFQEAFSRYLPEQGDFSRHNVTARINIDENEKLTRHSEKACDGFKTHDTRINIGLCRRDGLKGGEGRYQPVFDDPERREAWDSWKEGNA